MSIKQSVVNDVSVLKNKIHENWEDILATADSIEKLITDGLEWVQNPANQKTITDTFDNVKNTIENDLDLSTIEQDFDKAMGSVEEELSQYLDPMLAQLKNIEADMSPEELFQLIENSMPDIPGMSEVTEGLEDVLSPTKRIMQEILKEGFSITLKDLPISVGSTAASVTNNDSSLLGILTSGLDTHLDSVYSKHKDKLESSLKDFLGLIDQDAITSVESSTKDLVSQLESGNIDTSELLNSLKTLISNEGKVAKKIGQEFISRTSNDFQSTSALLSDLLTEEVDNEIFPLIWPNHSCTLISIVSLIIAIPLSLLDASIDENKRPILSLINNSISQIYNGKDVAYGAMQVMDGLGMLFEILPDLNEFFDTRLSLYNHNSYLVVNLVLSICSLIFTVIAQIVSIPNTLNESEKVYPSLVAQNGWQFGVWGFQFVFVAFATFEIIVYVGLLIKRFRDSDDDGNPLLEIPMLEVSNTQASATPAQPSTPAVVDSLGKTIMGWESVLAIVELALEMLHLVGFVGLKISEDRVSDKANQSTVKKDYSNNTTSGYKKALYFVDVIPGILGNGLEMYRLYYDYQHSSVELKDKPTSYRVAAISEALIDLGSQMSYGGLYINKGGG